MTLTIVSPSRVDYQRDQWGRPLIMVDGRRVPYTRASSAAKDVEDHYNLEMWARRNIAYGMAHDASLVARVLAVGGEPSTWSTDERNGVNLICDKATEVAKAHRSADIGTAVHRITQLTDLGTPVDAGPYEADVEAYVDALVVAGYEVDPAYIECHLVCDALQLAGTADRILTRVSDRMRLIADIKTGTSVDYGGLGWAAQLAAYAHGQLYDVDTEERLETPAIDPTTGIVIHIPAGQGVCTLYEIDLVAGYRAAELANEIRATRRASKRWIRPLQAVPAEAVARHPAGADRRTVLRERFLALDASRRIAYMARNVDRDDLDTIEQTLDAIEARPVDAARIGAPGVQDMVARLLTITPDAKAQLDLFVREALEITGVAISYRFEPHERNVALCSALADWANSTLRVEDLRELVAAVSGDPTVEQPTIPLGVALAHLTLGQARTLAEMCSVL